jgi:hypothetical protein
MALRPAHLLPPKRLLTPRLARHLSTTNRGLLPGAPVPTGMGLPPTSLIQLLGRTMAHSLRSVLMRADDDAERSDEEERRS